MNVRAIGFGCDCNLIKPNFKKVGDSFVNPNEVFAITPGQDGNPRIISKSGYEVNPQEGGWALDTTKIKEALDIQV